jgi:AraC-like DNA-binding protein
VQQLANAGPLDTFPVIRSGDVDQTDHALRAVFGARKFALWGSHSDFFLRANHWQSRRIGISYCSYGAKVQVCFPGASFFRQQFSIHGSADIRIDRQARQVTADELCVVPAESDLEINFRPQFEQIVLRIEAEALQSKLSALIGAVPARSLQFEPTTRADKPAMEVLRRRLAFCITELGSEDLLDSPVAVAELEQLLILSFLRANANNYSSRIEARPRDVASWQVRLVEDYIEAHWNEPITIEALSMATCLPARSIFHHFKRARGQSPMEFVKQVRLHQARRLLEGSEGEVTVTAAAFACGFGNLSHFAKDYLARFGERPSETARRTKLARRRQAAG